MLNPDSKPRRYDRPSRRPSLGAVFRRAGTAIGAALLLAATQFGATAAADAGGSSGGSVEVDYQDPVTALPPVSRPPTAHCAVTVMRHSFANSYSDGPYTGTVTPPKECPGPWNKVVLTWSGSVQGRQYDRLGQVFIGGAEVFRTSTPEPDPDGIHWTVEKDITPFSPLLHSDQPLEVRLDNVVNDTYTGIYDMTLTLTYYETDRTHPAPHTADEVVPLSETATGDAYTLDAGASASKQVTLPRNLTDVQMEVYARGGGCDEQWFDAVPGDLAAKYPDYLCGGGPYREVQVAVDGRPAGLAQPYPVVYSGGIVPQMWRPIPAVDQFLTQAYDIDLTPFTGELVDGRPHTVTITPYGSADQWIVNGTLFLTTDHHAARTSGALTSDTLSATPDVHTAQTALDGDRTRVDVSADRAWQTSGYVDTSRGRVYTRVSQTSTYRNTDTVSAAGAQQVMEQQDHGATVVTTTAAGHQVQARHAWSYPITTDSDIASYTDYNNYDLSGTATQGRVLVDSVRHGGGPWAVTAFTDDRLAATGNVTRVSGGLTAADGTGAEHYTGTTDLGACYDRTLKAEHGYVTADHTRSCDLTAAALAALRGTEG